MSNTILDRIPTCFQPRQYAIDYLQLQSEINDLWISEQTNKYISHQCHLYELIVDKISNSRKNKTYALIPHDEQDIHRVQIDFFTNISGENLVEAILGYIKIIEHRVNNLIKQIPYNKKKKYELQFYILSELPVHNCSNILSIDIRSPQSGIPIKLWVCDTENVKRYVLSVSPKILII